jgi:hypothetical protein
MPRGRPKGSKNRPKLSAYNKNKVKQARERLQEMQCPLFDRLPDADVDQFVVVKGGNVYIRWDFIQRYLTGIAEKIHRMFGVNQP